MQRQLGVQQKSCRDDMSVQEKMLLFDIKYFWNNLLILTCHPYGILLTANIFSTDMSSLRDFLSYTNNLTMHILLFIHKNNFFSFLSLLKAGNLNFRFGRRQPKSKIVN
jgi:hypothetical protein